MKTACLAIGLCVLVQGASASIYSDSFDSINPAWHADRYAPAFFDSIFDPTPRNSGNVLRLGVSDADSATNRPAAFADAFYNTQGQNLGINASTGPAWTVSADVFIDSSWDPALGNSRRTGLWTRDSNPVEGSSNYPIISFLSENSAFSLRAWDSLVGWQDLSTASFNGFDSWNTVSIEATGTSYDYFLNGTYLWSDTTVSMPGNEDLSRVFLQAYNFGQGGYEVYWDNLVVTPAPGSASLIGLGALTLIRRRR